ncbi:hypothetical protein DMUE_2632 [Dictyocoela muelleri]|nr:hypothetical protein DMUE_2632 [Dictyocoela muelleri]
MFFKTPPDQPFEKIIIDNKTFYKLIKQKPKRRYSDQFKQKNEYETFRKLKIVQKHRNIDFDSKIDKWKNCIDKCIQIFKNEFNFPVIELFKVFELEKYGFKEDDYE